MDFKKNPGTSILDQIGFSLVFSLKQDLLNSVRMGILRHRDFPDSPRQGEISPVDTEDDRKQKRLINAKNATRMEKDTLQLSALQSPLRPKSQIPNPFLYLEK